MAATTGASEALRRIQDEDRFDLLFTDIVLANGMNGRDLASLAVKDNPSLKVVFTSGYAENAIIHQGRLDPSVHLLGKPFRNLDLAIKIRRVLDGETSPTG